MTRAQGPEGGTRVLAAILAGGRSRRFGADKSAARVGGLPMVARVREAAARVADEVVLVSSRPVAGAEEAPRIPDRVPGLGPLGGLHSALHEARDRGLGAVLLLACDLPLVSAELLDALVRARGGAAALAPLDREGVPQVLCSVWDVATLSVAEDRLAGDDRSLQALFREVGGEGVGLEALGRDAGRDLLNVNTPEEWNRARRLAEHPTGGPVVVCVVGKKRSGKTTTVVGLVRELGRRGHRVMTVKHGHHFRLDREGTDSWRHRHEGGAARVVLAGPEGMAVAGEWGPRGEEPLERLVGRFLPDADVVVAEGFKASEAPRIEVYRRSVHEEALYRSGDPRYLAILTDEPGFRAHVPVLDVDDPDRFGSLAELVEGLLGG